MPRLRLGLFSTLNGPGSYALVNAIAAACAPAETPGDAPDDVQRAAPGQTPDATHVDRHGVIPADIAFLLVNRDQGEQPATDAAVQTLRDRYAFPIVRTSAYRFLRDRRNAAREADAAGDPGPLDAWRNAWYASFANHLPRTDLDLLLGDMWVWGTAECQDRSGLNLHPALPWGPAGKVWHAVIWDLVAAGAAESGAMLHRVIPAVDEGPVVSYCRYPIRGPAFDSMWAEIPSPPDALADLIEAERALGRQSQHPLFCAIRAAGLAREVPLMLATVQAVAEGLVRLEADGVVDAGGVVLGGGLDLTGAVEARLASA